MSQQNLKVFDEKLAFLQNYLLTYDAFSEDQKREMKHNFSRLQAEFKKRWIQCHKTTHIFLNKNAKWLEGTFSIPRITRPIGRPQKTFSELSERSKRRKTKDIRESTDAETLTYAARMKLNEQGKRTESKLLAEITTIPNRSKEYKQAFSNTSNKNIQRLSTLNALSMFVEASLSRKQYEVIKSSTNKIYPCYSLLLQEKKKCYPEKESYRVTETCAEIKLQSLMDLTVSRLSFYLEEVLLTLNEE